MTTIPLEAHRLAEIIREKHLCLECKAGEQRTQSIHDTFNNSNEIRKFQSYQMLIGKGAGLSDDAIRDTRAGKSSNPQDHAIAVLASKMVPRPSDIEQSLRGPKNHSPLALSQVDAQWVNAVLGTIRDVRE